MDALARRARRRTCSVVDDECKALSAATIRPVPSCQLGDYLPRGGSDVNCCIVGFGGGFLPSGRGVSARAWRESHCSLEAARPSQQKWGGQLPRPALNQVLRRDIASQSLRQSCMYFKICGLASSRSNGRANNITRARTSSTQMAVVGGGTIKVTDYLEGPSAGKVSQFASIR